MTHILMVEDDENTRMIIQAMLRHGGYSVETVMNAAGAWDALEHHSTPDLVILDLMLPGVDGITLCKQIRMRPDMLKTPILMLSVQSDPLCLRESKEAGASGYALKPIGLDDLLAKVRRLLPA